MIESKIKVICIDLDDAVKDYGSLIYENLFNGKSYLIAKFSIESEEEYCIYNQTHSAMKKTIEVCLILLILCIAGIFQSCNEIGDRNGVEGTYTNTKKGFYKSINFKSATTVIITDGIIGHEYATSYVIDGEIIRLKTDKSDLLFTVKDSKTLVGEGFAKGTYLKE